MSKYWILLTVSDDGVRETVWLLDESELEDMGIDPDNFDLSTDFGDYCTRYEKATDLVEIEVTKGNFDNLPLNRGLVPKF